MSDAAPAAGACLVVSVVVHEWCESELARALVALEASLGLAHEDGRLASATVCVLYNGDEAMDEAQARAQLSQWLSWPLALAAMPDNRGYGAGNNAVLQDAQRRARTDAVLVMNPDAVLEPGAISAMLWRMANDPACGLVAPRVLCKDGAHDRCGCKRYPSVMVLLARLFPVLQRLGRVRALNARYEYRDMRPDWPQRDVELCSGCCLLASMALWRELKGFDARYFLYFEDFDLSLRARYRGRVNLYEPAARVRHAGGSVACKDWRHRWWFIRSAWRFFTAHGWRPWRVGRPQR